MLIFFSVFPIVLLIWMMAKRNGLRSTIALPTTAFLLYVLQWLVFKSDLTLLNANIVTALISVLTPLSVIAGAIALNKLMKMSGAEETLRVALSRLSANPVAQLMIIGWAFAFMIEGASGFGTPAAIAAPILVGLGFPALRVALLALVMNSVPVTFGAVGTPTWFGLGHLGLTEANLLLIGQYSAGIHFVAGLVIPFMALRFCVSNVEIKANFVYVLLSVLSCTVPYLLLAQVNYEFPSLVGGAIGVGLSILLAKKGIGLQTKTVENSAANLNVLPAKTLIKAMMPMVLLILILVLTRIHQLGLKGLLNSKAPLIQLDLGSLGQLDISQALIFQLSHIFGTTASAAYKTLYVPAFIPFFLVVLIGIPLFGLTRQQCATLFQESVKPLKSTFIALFGALAMVNFLMLGGEAAPVFIIGRFFASLMGEYWIFIAPYLGALGAFFSGSNTVSNLTFGGIQQSIASSTGLNMAWILALQSVGGAMGNMVCLNNIIAVCSILGIVNQEGAIIRKTVVPMVVYGLISAFVSVFMLSFVF